MSDVLQELTLNGETTRAMELGGTGSYVTDVDDLDSGVGLWSVALSFRFVWSSPAVNPVIRPHFFCGLCAAGKPYAAGNSHAYGMRLFFDTPFVLDPFTPSDDGFFSNVFPVKSVNGVQTVLAAGTVLWVNRYEKAAGTQPFMHHIIGGTPLWLSQVVSNGYPNNSTAMDQDEFDAGLTARLPSVTTTSWAVAFAPSITFLSSVGSFPTPDEVTYGVLNKLNLWWDFPSGHSMYLHALNLKRG